MRDVERFFLISLAVIVLLAGIAVLNMLIPAMVHSFLRAFPL